jgi:type IV pilus assembly protein PilZ
LDRGYGGDVAAGGERSEFPPPSRPGAERREAERVDVEWAVDCETEETFLFANITNISALGIFVSSRQPLPLGTRVRMRFAPPGTAEPFALFGEVAWVNPVRLLSPCKNPGMGIRFVDLRREDRERLIDAVHTIAYLRDRSN